MGMPSITFHGGKLNNRKKFVEPLRPEYVYEYIESNIPDHDLMNINPVEDVYFHRIREVYILTKAAKMVGNKRITRIGYVKEGSKTKPETVWNRGLFHSQAERMYIGNTGYWK
jgi:hypothetical protein